MACCPWPDARGLEIFDLLVPAPGRPLQSGALTVFVISLVIGLPLAVIVHNTSPSGLFPRGGAPHASVIINILRSIPFLILMAAVIPFSRFIMGTALGVAGAIVPLSLASIPLFATHRDQPAREVRYPLVDAARRQRGTAGRSSAACCPRLPGIVGNDDRDRRHRRVRRGGAVGAGGLAISPSRTATAADGNMMLACVVVLVVIAQITQFSVARIGSRGRSRSSAAKRPAGEGGCLARLVNDPRELARSPHRPAPGGQVDELEFRQRVISPTIGWPARTIAVITLPRSSSTPSWWGCRWHRRAG